MSGVDQWSHYQRDSVGAELWQLRGSWSNYFWMKMMKANSDGGGNNNDMERIRQAGCSFKHKTLAVNSKQ